MAGLREFPFRLRIYLLVIMGTGAAVPLYLLFADRGALEGRWPRLLLLLILAVAAERFTLHLTHKMSINVSTDVYLAAVFVFPAALSGALGYVASWFGQQFRGHRDPIETSFNAGQRGLSYLAAGLVYHAMLDRDRLGPDVAGFGGIVALIAAALTAHFVTTMIVAVAAGLQLSTNPLRVFAVTFRADLAPEAAMAALAIQTAFLLREQPILVPIVALPLGLVYVAMRETGRLRTDTFRAMADLVEVVELRDPYTAGHSRRVAELARAIALRLGLTNEEADIIESAGLVHDLGKVGIDPEVLSNPGKLSAEEFTEMRRHPVLGADVIARFAAYGDGWQLIRHHHERWDGNGYPDGVAGEAIPLGARILAVADTYDALTSARPYRGAQTSSFALQILSDGAGSQWDPAVVDVLIAFIAEPAPQQQPSQSYELVQAPV